MALIDKMRNLMNKGIITSEPTKERVVIGEKDILRAIETLRAYKGAKAKLEDKIIQNEKYWKLKQWNNSKIKSTPWLFNCIESRYADIMESYPTCNIKPRQQDDKAEAIKLSSIVPVILSANDYDKTYSELAHYVLKNGTGIQGVFWNGQLHGGLGDIEIRKIDVLSFYCDISCTNIQDSENIFVVSLENKKNIESKYPQTRGKLGKNLVEVQHYAYDDVVTPNKDDKCAVIDWYYKRIDDSGRTILHFAKFVDTILLESTENDPERYPYGYYEHGKYPFVVTNLYSVEGSAFGYGLIDIAKTTQNDIDTISDAIVRNAKAGAAPKTFIKENAGVSKEDLEDFTKQYVTCEGSVNDDNIKVVQAAALNGNYVSVYQNKIEELKYCTANQDVNNGVAPSGITAASAVAALQETAGRQARVTNKTFYRSFREVCYQVIELIRQFYNQPREFRIAPDTVEETYITYENNGLVAQEMMLGNEYMGMRLPEFDINVVPEKQNPYKKIENNEFVLQLYGLGFFNPQNSNQALPCLEMMDFDRKEEFIRKIKENGTMYEQLIQFERIALELAQKYDPSLAQQLSQIVLQTQGYDSGNMSMPNMTPLLGDENTDEHPVVEKAREQARNSSEV